MTVELAISPDRRWQASAAELIEATAAAGLGGLGTFLDQADAETAGAFRAAGLRCHEVLALVLGDDERTTVASAEALADAAATMDAPWVLTVFPSALSSHTEKLVERCATILAEAGAGMAVEFSPLGPIATIPQGLEVVRVARRGSGRAGLLIDSWHFFRGGSTWDDLATVPLDEIAYVQFDDALAPESNSLARETMHRRALPGEGVLDLHRFAATLLDRGWQGTVSVEVLSAVLRALPITDITRRIHAVTTPYWLPPHS